MKNGINQRYIRVIPAHQPPALDRCVQVAGDDQHVWSMLTSLGMSGWFAVLPVGQTRDEGRSPIAVISSVEQAFMDDGLTFFVDDARSRLALLSHIAALSRTRESSPLAIDLEREHFISSLPSQLYRDVAEIQCTFAVKLTESELAIRLQVSPSTLRRWFVSAGSMRPKRLLLWVQLHEVLLHVAVSGKPLDTVSLELGFEHPEAVRRTLRLLTRGAIRPSRIASAYPKFLRCLHLAINH